MIRAACSGAVVGPGRSGSGSWWAWRSWPGSSSSSRTAAVARAASTDEPVRTRIVSPRLMFQALGAASGAISVDRDRSRSKLEKMTWYSGENVAERVGVDPSYLVRLVDRAERHHS